MDAHTVTLTSPTLWNFAQTKAAKLRMSVSEYISRLIVRDKRAEPEHIPAEVAGRWKKEMRAFIAEDRKNPKPRFTTAQETIDYINRLP